MGFMEAPINSKHGVKPFRTWTCMRQQRTGVPLLVMETYMKFTVPALVFIILAGTQLPAQAQSIPNTAGWFEIPNTTLRSVCPPANFGGTSYDFSYYCKGIVEGWSSG